MRILQGILIMLAAAFAAGCSTSECYDNHSALPLADFFNSENMQPVSLVNLEIYGIGAPNDSILYTTQTLSKAYLPFRLWEKTTKYVFAYRGLVPPDEEETAVVPTDTITFNYTPKEWFVSPSCGAMYFYDMQSVDHTTFLIDSISFNSVITNENVSNIKIFFRPALAR